MDEKQVVGEWEDPIVKEVREIREAHAKKFNYDLDAIFDDLLKKQAQNEKLGFKYVTLPPKLSLKHAKTSF